ncbi:MAG: FMN-binding protein [Candidatus Omnitrophica bacterium]|nr:FMN-binding protein [Candidatus Omnitrophota bacterium]
MKRLFSFFLVLFLVIAALWHYREVGSGANLNLETVRQIFPAAVKIGYKKDPFPYHIAYRLDPKTGEEIIEGYAFLTTDVVPEVKGYAGPIVILAGVDPEGKIQGLKVLAHQETASYADGITHDGWLKQFIGLGPDSDISVEGEIDAISSATVTSRAVCRAVKESLAIVSEKILSRPLTNPKRPFVPPGVQGIWEMAALGILFAASVLAYLFSWKRVRTVILLAAFLFLGLKLKLLFSGVQLAALLKGQLPSWDLAPFLWVFLALVFVTTLLFGRLYCGFLCPFGFIQEWLYKILPWFVVVKSEKDRAMKSAKYYLLWFCLVLSLLYPVFQVDRFEPFAVMFTWKGTSWVVCFLLTVLGFSLLIERFYCRYFCMAGAFLSLLGKFSLTRLGSGEKCLQCHACDEVCPVQAIQNAEIRTDECLLCNQCKIECPEQDIRIQRRNGRDFFQKKT